MGLKEWRISARRERVENSALLNGDLVSERSPVAGLLLALVPLHVSLLRAEWPCESRKGETYE